MKILHVTNYDNLGGAGIAAYRLHTALRKAGVDSRMLVRTKGSEDPFVTEVGTGEVRFADFTGQGDQPVRHSLGDGGRSEISSPKAHSLWSKALSSSLAVRGRGWLGTQVTRLLGMNACSLNILPTGLHKVLNASDAEIIHLHWINNEMISIKEIAKIKKPIIWTLHDCWPLLGAEHHSDANEYFRSNVESGTLDVECTSHISHSTFHIPDPTSHISRPTTHAVFRAVNKYIFRMKQRAWKRLPVSFIAPSNWMAEQVRQSKLFADAPVKVIPNCLDLEVFQPLEPSECRQRFGLPQDKQLILFGAFDPMDPNKGMDLMEQALLAMTEDVRAGMGVVVFGCKGNRKIAGLETHWMGAVSSEETMTELYNTADVVCVPSRKETLPTVIAEALACGVPCVGFNIGGLPDMIGHKVNGWLAEPYDTEELAKGITWILTEDKCPATGCYALSQMARAKAEGMFSSDAIAHRCVHLYEMKEVESL